MHGEYLANSEKIILCYYYKNSNYFEIVRLDEANENFILEYIIEENFPDKKKMIKYFQTLGIQYMIDQIKNNEVVLGANLKFHCHKNINKSGESNDNIDTNDYGQNKIIDIISALMSLRLFENEIIYKLELSKKLINDLNTDTNSNPLSTISCNVINMNFLTILKKIFNYKKIIEIMNQNQIKKEEDINNEKISNLLKEHPNYTNFLKSKKNDFLSLKGNPKELTEFDVVCVNQDDNKFYYPMNFNIINNNLFNKLLNALNIKETNDLNKLEEIMVTFNHGKLAFKGLNNNFCGNKMLSLFYLYSAENNQESNSINFYPEAILDFKTPENLFNQFSSMMKEDILYNLIQCPQYFLLNYNCKILLIFNQDIKNCDTSNSSPKKVKISLNQKNFQQSKNSKSIREECFEIQIKNLTEIKFRKAYIVKKGIIDKLSEIYNINEVISYLNNRQQLSQINYNNFDENYKKLSLYLNEKQKNYINKIKQKESEKISNFKEDENSLVVNKLKNNSNLKYIDDFEIIDEEFAQYLFQIFNPSLTFYQVNYVKIKNKIFLVIYLDQKPILEIIKINDNNIIKVLYLIEIVKNNFIEDTYELINYIGNALMDYGISKLSSYDKVINIEKNLSINFHAINKDI